MTSVRWYRINVFKILKSKQRKRYDLLEYFYLKFSDLFTFRIKHTKVAQRVVCFLLTKQKYVL